MIKKKICMLGAFSVGKTSLVRQYIKSEFFEKYHTTVGVKVDKKEVEVDGQRADLLIWDIHGEDSTQDILTTYLRGSSGYILVADGTRKETLDVASRIGARVVQVVGNIPSVLLLNKADLNEKWELDDATVGRLRTARRPVLKTSAKTGTGVEEAFVGLARDLLAD